MERSEGMELCKQKRHKTVSTLYMWIDEMDMLKNGALAGKGRWLKVTLAFFGSVWFGLLYLINTLTHDYHDVDVVTNSGLRSHVIGIACNTNWLIE